MQNLKLWDTKRHIALKVASAINKFCMYGLVLPSA